MDDVSSLSLIQPNQLVTRVINQGEIKQKLLPSAFFLVVDALTVGQVKSLYSNKVCPSNLPFCFLLPFPVEVPILFLITFIHVNFQQSLQYVCKLMNICLFNLKPSVYIRQVPAEMLRLQTFRNPIPTLKEHII